VATVDRATGLVIPVKKTCARCPQTFFSKRDDAIYCSTSCRVLACNERKQVINAALAAPRKTLRQCVKSLEVIARAFAQT
jgi:hypothetical protein